MYASRVLTLYPEILVCWRFRPPVSHFNFSLSSWLPSVSTLAQPTREHLTLPFLSIILHMFLSCVGVWQNDRVEIIANDCGNRTTPSYVSFSDNERLIGDAAKNQVAMNPQNTYVHQYVLYVLMSNAPPLVYLTQNVSLVASLRMSRSNQIWSTSPSRSSARVANPTSMLNTAARKKSLYVSLSFIFWLTLYQLL